MNLVHTSRDEVIGITKVQARDSIAGLAVILRQSGPSRGERLFRMCSLDPEHNAIIGAFVIHDNVAISTSRREHVCSK